MLHLGSYSLLSVIVTIVARVSQLLAELLVVSITWWYTYQSYRIKKGIKFRNSISSFLIYNGEPFHRSLGAG